MTARPRPQIMTVTDVAAEQIRQVMTSKPEAVALKIGLKKGGCAGMEYTLDWADEVGKHDEVVETNGVKLLVDPMAVMYMFGTVMDYQIDKFSAQFVFNNPNQTSACGCGESVELKPIDKAQMESAEA
ncbi:MAG: iron-sulfur cluster assembly protein [Hyphomicrobiaceae bacterium]|jgi:iron-sulfur cluster assembly protein